MGRYIVFVLFLVACGTAPISVPPAPTSLPTAIPLSAIDLEPLLIQSGDLPAGITGAQVRDTPPKMFDGMPKAAKAIYQQFARGTDQIGGVSVFLYEKDTDRDQGYGFILGGMNTAQVTEGVGEQAVIAGPSKETAAVLNFSDLLLRRCRAIAHIRMTGKDTAEAVTAYAKRLDTRLSEVVC